MKILDKETGLPKDFKGYFWDCDFSLLDYRKKYRRFILGRLLHYGGLRAMVWLRKNFSRQEIRDYLLRRGKIELDRRSYLFWSKCVRFKEIW